MSNYNTQLQGYNAELQEILSAVNNLPEAGVVLPTLSNPAGAAQVRQGYQAIDEDGNVIIGTYTGVVLPTLSNPASITKIKKGFQAFDQNGNLMTGTWVESELAALSPAAGPEHILSGYKAYNSSKEVITGTYVPSGDGGGGATGDKVSVTFVHSGLNTLSVSYVIDGARTTAPVVITSGSTITVDKGSMIMLTAVYTRNTSNTFSFTKTGSIANLSEFGATNSLATTRYLVADALGDTESGQITVRYTSNSAS